MEDKRKKQIAILIILTVLTVGLGAAAVVTSLLLQKKSTVPATPAAPESQPEAQEAPACVVSFSVTASGCYEWCDDTADCGGGGLECQTNLCVNPSCSAESTCVCPTATPSPTVVPECNSTCTIGQAGTCPDALECTDVGSGDARCRLPTCTEEASCICPTPTPTATPTPSNTPTPTVTPSATPTVTNTPTPSTTLRPSPTNTPTGVPLTATPIPTNTPVPTNTPTTPPGQPSNTPAPPPTYIAQGPTPSTALRASVTPVPQLPQAGTDTASITLLVMGIAVVMLGLLGVLVF